MKKIMVLLMVGLMVITGSMTVFAEETTDDVSERSVKAERTSEERREKLEELFSTYNPDGLDAFNAAVDEHKAFHEMAQSEKEAFRLEIQAEKEAIRAQYDNGELTKEEVRAIVEEAKAERELIKEELLEIRVLKKADVEAIKVEVQAVRTSLKEALQAEEIDTVYVGSLLDKLVELLEEHIDVDYLYYYMIQDLRPVVEI